MEIEIFTKHKEELIKQINEYSKFNIVNKLNQETLKKLLEILNEYSFENRLQMKGTLSHTIIDSLEMDYTIGEKCIKFDDSIK